MADQKALEVPHPPRKAVRPPRRPKAKQSRVARVIARGRVARHGLKGT